MVWEPLQRSCRCRAEDRQCPPTRKQIRNTQLLRRKTSLAFQFEELAIAIERGAYVIRWLKTRASVLVSPMMTFKQSASCPTSSQKQDSTSAVAAGRLGTTVWTVKRFRRLPAASTCFVHARDSLRALNTLASDVMEMGGRCVCHTL